MASRETIIQTLTRNLDQLDYVHAFWEGGAIGYGRVDDWSDIDLYILVDESRIKDTFKVVEETLQSLSPIKQKYETKQLPWPGVSQRFYRLENTSDYLVIDLAVLTLNSPEKFLEPKVHGDAVLYFNKLGRIKKPTLDKKDFVKKIQQRLARLKARFAMFDSFVQKEINRRNQLEALNLYYTITLSSLVEVLRIKHYPLHYNFKMRYIHYELPSETIEKLKQLYFITDENDLQRKYGEAKNWFTKTMEEIDIGQIENMIK